MKTIETKYNCPFCKKSLKMVNERDIGYMCANEDCRATVGIVFHGERKASYNFRPIDNKKALEIAESGTMSTLCIKNWDGNKVRILK